MTLRVGIAGLGTVGAEVFRRLSMMPSFKITAVSARDSGKNRGIDLKNVTWVNNAIDLAMRDDVDMVVEVMGGDGDPAYSLVATALKNGKTVVTANKALLARHGTELAKIADDNKGKLFFEAAVAGGIPIIKMLREGLAANKIQAIYGILNGTCNYILTTMEETGADFDSVLNDAQKLGYAESDPTLDVDGGDTAHKLSILSGLAFGGLPPHECAHVSGIRSVTVDDMAMAREWGFTLKLVGQARREDTGKILHMVCPCFVPNASPLAHVGGVLNAILIESDLVGQSFVAGRGAGALPTASAVLADILDAARGVILPSFAVSSQAIDYSGFADWAGEFYVRLVVKDEAGVIAAIAPILRDCGISIENLLQRGRSSDQPVSVMMMTHPTMGKNIQTALEKIAHLPCVVARPVAIPVLKV